MLKSIIKGKLASNSLIYLVINGVNAIVPFLMLPILTSALSPTEYGTWGLFIAITTFIAPIVSLGLDSAAGRKYFDLSSDEFKIYTGTTFSLMCIAFIILSVLIQLGSQLFAQHAHMPLWWFFCIPFYLVSNSIINTTKVIATNTDSYLLYSVCLLGNRLIQTGIVIFTLIWLHYGIDSIIISYMASLSITVFVGGTWLYQSCYLRFSFSKVLAKKALNFGVPLVPYLIGLSIISASARIFIDQMLSTSDVGLYTAANQVSAAFLLLLTSVSMSWSPWLLRKMRDQSDVKIRVLVTKATYSILAAICILVIFLAATLPFAASLLLGQKFSGSQSLIPWLVISWGFFGLYLILYSFLLHKEKTKTAALIVLFAVIINLPCTYIFIKFNGLIGAAQAAGCTYLFMFLYTAIWVFKNIELPWLFFIPKEKVTSA